MTKKWKTSPKKEKQKTKLSFRLSIPILLVVIFQMLTFIITMTVGGEFRDIRQYANNTLLEKTENRCNYIRTELQEKPAIVQEYSEQVNSLVAGILKKNNATVSKLQTDKNLNRSIIESSVEIISNLLRRSQANDAYIILENGKLYADEGMDKAKSALYLRDVDPKSGSGYSDLLMEVGYASLSKNYGITRHSGWSMYFMPDPDDTKNFDFYYRTLETAMENSDLPQNSLGYWSGFSKPSSMTTPSMKYTVPLIAEDGTVYGVMGIGLTESAILSNIPSHDFLAETACYVLGRSKSGDTFDVVTYSGSAYNKLLGDENTLHVDSVKEDIYSFNQVTDIALTGSVQFIDLYGQNSPYGAEKWALISVADRATVLRPLLFLRQMLMISALISLLVAGGLAFLSCIKLIKPISNAIKLMNDTQKYNEIIHFAPSNIYEIDKMTDAITQLQVNSQSFSSQVSRMISIADVGLGTYMYDHADDSIFVGQSFQKFLSEKIRLEQDTVMSRQDFLDSIFSDEIRRAIQDRMESSDDRISEDFSKVYHIELKDGSTQWIRLSTVHADDRSIGILQDITETMLEKKRIEYERDYDALTGLLNRHAYYQQIEELFHDKDKLKITAFIMIDLDNLKYVNDSYGHDFGDDYIKTAASALTAFRNYGGIISRISGDEFNVCLPGFDSKDEVREIIAKVRDQLLKSSCLLADGTHFRIRASIGVAWYPDDAQTYEMLMKYADFAMYTVKHSTKGEIAEFNMKTYVTDSVLFTGVEEMNRIIDESRVQYAFQSIISAKTGKVYGYEALMRVKSDIFQSPLDLLRAAKNGAKLYEIERLTWTKALADFQDLVDRGQIAKNTHIFVNSIANSRLEPEDEAALEKNHPQLMKRIVIEILENESSNENCAVHKRQMIKRWGGQIALDDFGTGYNSEYALLDIQPDIIKIDRSITSGCNNDISRRMIIHNLVRLARTKQILVLAEGVETEEEMETVIACGVDLVQGYYFDYPLFEPQPLSPEIAEKIRNAAKHRIENEDHE
ncbi:MAG: EAL domain-containing protein [Oscillospiraceae bacterium]|nr:EAL domain-containing protein [Oscillospiraceae bacterium]